jgi:hypothetical protein
MDRASQEGEHVSHQPLDVVRFEGKTYTVHQVNERFIVLRRPEGGLKTVYSPLLETLEPIALPEVRVLPAQASRALPGSGHIVCSYPDAYAIFETVYIPEGFGPKSSLKWQMRLQGSSDFMGAPDFETAKKTCQAVMAVWHHA